MVTNMILENWAWFCTNASPYTAPELLKFSLKGEVRGHPSRPNGQTITTSQVIGLGPVPNSVRTKLNSIYILGNPNAEYEAKFPGSKERLLKSLSPKIEK